MKTQVRAWLQEGTIDLFLGYKMVMGHPLPYSFTAENLDELEDLVDGPARYALEKIATHIAARDPNLRIGLISRDCTRRALNVLYVWNQLQADHIQTLPVNCCPSMLKDHVDCSYLTPAEPAPIKQQMGVDKTMRPSDLEAMAPGERLSRWMYEFQKCIKCYGCRNICPVCFCKECSLEHGDLIGKGALPPEVPIFHLVRAVHMAGRCVDCGLCEDACPVDIPLRLLYRKVGEIVQDVFDYTPGAGEESSPFSILGEKVTLTPKPIERFDAAN